MSKIIKWFKDWVDYFKVQKEFHRDTVTLPKKMPHHKCLFVDWVDGKTKEGWYIRDEYGHMIPWVHFDRGIICLYEDMITKVD